MITAGANEKSGGAPDRYCVTLSLLRIVGRVGVNRVLEPAMSDEERRALSQVPGSSPGGAANITDLVSEGFAEPTVNLTGQPEDLSNAGGDWFDFSVVQAGNWVTGGQPDDLPTFNHAMLRLFSRSRSAVHYSPQ
jgi:hypothetical protein